MKKYENIKKLKKLKKSLKKYLILIERNYPP